MDNLITNPFSEMSNTLAEIVFFQNTQLKEIGVLLNEFNRHIMNEVSAVAELLETVNQAVYSHLNESINELMQVFREYLKDLLESSAKVAYEAVNQSWIDTSLHELSIDQEYMVDIQPNAPPSTNLNDSRSVAYTFLTVTVVLSVMFIVINADHIDSWVSSYRVISPLNNYLVEIADNFIKEGIIGAAMIVIGILIKK